MVTAAETVALVAASTSWDERVNRIRLIPARHGTDEHAGIFAAVARQLYVPHLAPDFAYIHEAPFYELPHFQEAYDLAVAATDHFTKVSDADLEAALLSHPRVLLPLRVITGLTRDEFSASTRLVAEALDLRPISANKVDSMERTGTGVTAEQASVIAQTINRIMDGTLFGDPGGDARRTQGMARNDDGWETIATFTRDASGSLRRKQHKPDTVGGWTTVQRFARDGVPYGTFLNQRHYGGAFRQVLDATSEQRGDLIEDAVEQLFIAHRVPYIRTGGTNQHGIVERFEVAVTPAPDFVVFDSSDTLRGMLECKGANNGGTARDKALRFERLRDESIRLGGIPLFGVLGGLGWTRVNDTLGPVVRDCDGRVFSVSNLDEMMTVAPFSWIAGMVQT